MRLSATRQSILNAGSALELAFPSCFHVLIIRSSFNLPVRLQGLMSKLVPQPQLLLAAGFPTILN